MGLNPSNDQIGQELDLNKDDFHQAHGGSCWRIRIIWIEALEGPSEISRWWSEAEPPVGGK